MNIIALIDTSVFIIAYNEPKSNCGIIENLIDEGAIIPVISELVLEELANYFKKYQNEKIVYKAIRHLSTACDIVYRDEIKSEMESLKGKIKNKDLEHLATVMHLGIKNLVAFDRDFEAFEEYKTPKQFIKSLGLKPYSTEY